MNGNSTDIRQCRYCLALINGRAHDVLANDVIQNIQSTDYYYSGALTQADALRQLKEKAGILDYLYQKVSLPFEDLTFCDFGAGQGFVAMAAARRFRFSYICEFDRRSAEEVCSILGKPENLEIVGSLSDVQKPIDVFFMWHVLEHIPQPLAFLEASLPYLSPNCIFFLQCPGYRPDSIVDCHYTFFNEPSLRTLFAKAGVREIEIGFDVHNGFIGYLGQLTA
jgi:2-polyprenyl-3-methyl-5-hydroxy-6-metoxy-1,4-benzoquinol methylase